jgi:hypothetical protein
MLDEPEQELEVVPDAKRSAVFSHTTVVPLTVGACRVDSNDSFPVRELVCFGETANTAPVFPAAAMQYKQCGRRGGCVLRYEELIRALDATHLEGFCLDGCRDGRRH